MQQELRTSLVRDLNAKELVCVPTKFECSKSRDKKVISL